jgi:DNA-binding transcriptional regulator YdaS (Cro superfamily)
MDLVEYGKQRRGAFVAIARAVGVTPTTITLIAKRRRRPSLELASRIAAACDGAVSAADLRNGAIEAGHADPAAPFCTDGDQAEPSP